MKRIGFAWSLANVFVWFDQKMLLVPSMVLSTIMCLVTVTFVPWAVPMVADFYGTNGRVKFALSTKKQGVA